MEQNVLVTNFKLKCPNCAYDMSVRCDQKVAQTITTISTISPTQYFSFGSNIQPVSAFSLPRSAFDQQQSGAMMVSAFSQNSFEPINNNNNNNDNNKPCPRRNPERSTRKVPERYS